MRRDVITTVGGLIVVAVVVVATFLYGNLQRESQTKKDQQVQQQTAQTEGAKKDNVAVNSNSQSQTEQPKSNTAPDTAIQGTPNSSAEPVPTTNSQTAAMPAETPKTGSGVVYIALTLAMLTLAHHLRLVKKSVRTAALNV